MGRSLILAFALMLVLEGIIPFVAPATWRETFTRLLRLADGQIRFVGLGSVLLGLVILLVFT